MYLNKVQYNFDIAHCRFAMRAIEQSDLASSSNPQWILHLIIDDSAKSQFPPQVISEPPTNSHLSPPFNVLLRRSKIITKKEKKNLRLHEMR